MDDDRPRFIERARTPQTPAEARRNRSTLMLTLGVIAFVVGVIALSSGSAVGALLGILGAGLIVGGLVIR